MRKKILTVDDSKTVRIIVRKAFKTYDCEITEAGNGVEGLAVAAREMPDLILLDVTMPVMDGVKLGGQLLQLHLRAVTVFDFGISQLGDQVVDGLLDAGEGCQRKGAQAEGAE